MGVRSLMGAQRTASMACCLTLPSDENLSSLEADDVSTVRPSAIARAMIPVEMDSRTLASLLSSIRWPRQ